MRAIPIQIKWLCFTLCVAAVLITTPHKVFAKQASEIEIGTELEKQIEYGEPNWLNNGASKFFSIYMADQTGKPKGAVILLHDANSHPNWPEIIHPLRTYLPFHGWATLSIQMPQFDEIGEYSTTQKIVNNRIDQATAFLKTKGINNIALIGHGTGAMSGITYLASGSKEIRGFIGISLGVIKYEEENPAYIPKQLEKVSVPILDIYGSKDLGMVTRFAHTRALAAKTSGANSNGKNNIEGYKRSSVATAAHSKISGYIAFRQVKIEGADHYFSGHQHVLTKRVLGWLDRHTKGIILGKR